MHTYAYGANTATHLLFLKKLVMVCVSDLDWGEFKKGQQLLLLVYSLLKELLNLQAK